MDYDKDSKTTQDFFSKVQNKLHWAIHGHTAPELIYNRANAKRENMGLQTWESAPNGKILKSDVIIAKNYLNQDELESLGRIVGAYLDIAEDMANRKLPMTMEDWVKHLDLILTANQRELLQNAEKISAAIAKEHAEREFELFRPIQDKAFLSDFDKDFLELEHITKEDNNE